MPEIADGLVEIQNVAREPGYRSKIAVVSHAAGVDPVGACVGPRGSRVRMVVSELRGEKIDIIPFNEEPARFVAKALSPARVREVLVDDENKQATVIVPDDQLSLAIGKEGQNARLAARLTGWRVDIRSETEFAEEEAETGYAGGGGRRPLRGDPRHRQALPERRAAGLALLRPAGAPGARRHRHRLGAPEASGDATAPRTRRSRSRTSRSQGSRSPRTVEAEDARGRGSRRGARAEAPDEEPADEEPGSTESDAEPEAEADRETRARTSVVAASPEQALRRLRALAPEARAAALRACERDRRDPSCAAEGPRRLLCCARVRREALGTRRQRPSERP